MSKITSLSIAFGIVVVSLSIAYYLVIFIPSNEAEERRVAEQSRSDLGNCLKDTFNSQQEALRLAEDSNNQQAAIQYIEKLTQNSREECYKMYPVE